MLISAIKHLRRILRRRASAKRRKAFRSSQLRATEQVRAEYARMFRPTRNTTAREDDNVSF